MNAVGFNTAAALLRDGIPVFAVEEERLIREKRTRKFPLTGIKAALAADGSTLDAVEAVAIAWNPAINLEAHSPAQSERSRYLGEMLYSVPSHLMTLRPAAEAELTRQRIVFVDGAAVDTWFVNHHAAHAGTFFFSPFAAAAVLTVDAFGERQCATISRGRDNRLERLWTQEFPHSLGAFYSTFTEFCGFKPQGDEWKLMGASSFGDARAFHAKVRGLVRLCDGGGFELDLSYFNHYQFHRPHYFSPKLAGYLGLPVNPRDRDLTQPYYDLAAAAQQVFEEVYAHLARAALAATGGDALVLAGGCAANSVANGRLLSQGTVGRLFVPPVPDDSGGAIGAAFWLHCQQFGRPRGYVMTENYLGPGYDDGTIAATLAKYKLRHRKPPDVPAEAARLIARGKIIGWFQGRLEFGDRALGNRSILADPRDATMTEKVNATVKYREAFRPFAPAVLAEAMEAFFTGAAPTPFMEKVFPVRPDKRAVIPAVTHVDGSGRLQTVTREQNPRFHALIAAFAELTGVPVVMNTSFNLKGEAMVASPEDAIRTFHTSGLDALFLGDFLLEK